MKIGVMLEGQEGLTWERWFRIADRVESLGLDSLWRSDHFFSLMGEPRRPALECWTALTALAQRTQRIRFGPLVSPMTFRHPALLARMAAAVDLLSNGRLVVGVGAGWNVAEHEAFGIGLPPLKERFDRFEEGIAVIKALWTGGPVDFDGRYYPLRGAAAHLWWSYYRAIKNREGVIAGEKANDVSNIVAVAKRRPMNAKITARKAPGSKP